MQKLYSDFKGLIAIAYATAKAKAVLGKQPKRIEIGCSENMVKNVKDVAVPKQEVL